MRAARSKLLAAFAIALGMLMLAASPASATLVCIPVPATGLSGVLTIDTTDFPFPDEESEPPCESDYSGLHFKFEENASSSPDWFWWVKGTIKSVFEFPKFSGNWWQVDVSFDEVIFPNGGGLTWDTSVSPPEWIVDGLLTPQVTIYDLDGGESCEKDDPVCDLIMQLEVDSMSSRHFGSVAPLASDVIHIEAATDPNGIRPFAVGSCNATVQGFLEHQYIGLIMDIVW